MNVSYNDTLSFKIRDMNLRTQCEIMRCIDKALSPYETFYRMGHSDPEEYLNHLTFGELNLYVVDLPKFPWKLFGVEASSKFIRRRFNPEFTDWYQLMDRLTYTLPKYEDFEKLYSCPYIMYYNTHYKYKLGIETWNDQLMQIVAFRVSDYGYRTETPFGVKTQNAVTHVQRAVRMRESKDMFGPEYIHEPSDYRVFLNTATIEWSAFDPVHAREIKVTEYQSIKTLSDLTIVTDDMLRLQKEGYSFVIMYGNEANGGNCDLVIWMIDNYELGGPRVTPRMR